MITTLKTTYSCPDKNFSKHLYILRKEQSCVLRWAYNRIKKQNLSEKDVRLKSKNLKNISNIDSWFVQSAIKGAKGIYNRFKNQTVIFGGRHAFYQRLKRKISREEYQNQKLSNLISIGESSKKGNRKFALDIKNQILIFKPDRKHKFYLKLNLKSNYKKKFQLLEILINETPTPFTIELNDNEVFISFDEPYFYQEKQLDLIANRYISLDLNPNHIGVTIVDNKKILKKLDFDLSYLTQPLEVIRRKRHYSNLKLEKYLNNKLNYETVQISKKIESFIKAYRPKYLFLEDLSIQPKNIGRGKRYNKSVNNLWKRNLFSNNLIKRAENLGLEVYKTDPRYSSYIGNLQYESFDPVNSARHEI